MRRHRHGGLFDRVTSIPNLFSAARKALRGRGSRMPGAAFLADLETEVVALSHEMRSRTYRPGAYHYFEIHEPKRRIVAAAPFRDRVVHHAICRILEPIWERRFVADSFACRTGKGTHAGMRRALSMARRHPWVMGCDIRRYFPSVNHAVLLATICRVVADQRLIDLVRLILESHSQVEGAVHEAGEAGRGLPIGNLTSQFLANVMLDPFDHFVTESVRPGGYVRYMDDFLIFGDSRGQLREFGRRVREQLALLDLEIHPDKYRLVRSRDGVDFVGFTVFADGRVRLRERSLKNFRRRYRHLLASVRRGQARPAEVTASVRSWVAHARHAHSEPLRTALLGDPRRSRIGTSGTVGRGGG